MESKYNHNEVEPKWIEKWLQSEIYRWDPARPRSETFVVDTPPPTVSGSLHIGHVFSYTQTDVIVRYQRMLGKNIFYPIGWDDNGLATERRVQNYFAIRCEPHLPYDPAWKPVQPQNTEQKAHDISRRNFIEACAVLTREDEVAFERLFKRVGLSYDWSLQYATIDKHCQRISQYSFLDLHSKGFLYQSDAPGMWDVTFKTAVAQAEIEDREIAGAFHDVRFGVEGGGEFIISTTRPELIPACIAVVAHPDDQRYQALFGKTALTPLFHAAVPIHPSPHADPEKGSGIMMVCTFGDIMDVQWWKQSGLPIKQVISPAGTLSKVEYGSGPFQSENKERAKNNYNQLAGLNIKQAQKKIVELLAAPGSSVDGANAALVGDPKPIKHIVKFYEKGDRPIEFIPTRQWFINILDHKEALLEYGRKIAWHPGFMLTRYEHWVQGLNQDWCISRQRYFGVSIPAWYPLSSDGKPDYSKLILPEQQNLPVDPMADCPPGYLPEQRDKPGGFCGDPDVMDTWATSALTPQIQSAWGIDASRHDKLFPMDMRPQAHDIIRTWAFYTVAKAWMHEQKIPWKNAVISGFIMDPDRKKMSKSKGNVVTPEGLINEHSADAVRYWASRARLGMDTAFDESLFKIGRKLSTKIYNASRFVLMQFERVGMKPGNLTPSAISEELDCAMVEELRSAISHATNS
ncbi:MAG: valine--tRNA ligase, partial [Proteobacteria bacterium]